MSLEKSYDMFMSLQCNFNLLLCKEIFGNLSEHIFEKWIICDGNIINFLSHLDNENRNKIYIWLQTM